MIKRLFIVLQLIGFCVALSAQTSIRLHYKNGGYSDVSTEQIDSITFVRRNEKPVVDVGVTGSWLWGDAEAGYYELLTFNEDKTYTGYDNYFTYGFDTMTYGWYGLLGTMLTLQSNGFGYSRRYTWYVMGLTENAFDVMTKMGRFVYYRVQPETISIHVGDTLECAEGDSLVFVDGVVVAVSDNKLLGVAKGITYFQKYIAQKNCVVAYKVVVI